MNDKSSNLFDHKQRMVEGVSIHVIDLELAWKNYRKYSGHFSPEEQLKEVISLIKKFYKSKSLKQNHFCFYPISVTFTD